MRLSVSFPNRRNLAPSQQGEEQGVGLGGWAGGACGHVRGAGAERVRGKEAREPRGACVGHSAHGPGAPGLGGGRSPRKQSVLL